jgi:FkbM family methyltransferase
MGNFRNKFKYQLAKNFHRLRNDNASAVLKTIFVRYFLRRPILTRDRNDFLLRVLPGEPIYSLFAYGYLGYPEIGEQEFCRSVLERGMVAIDVGANIGQFTLLFGRLVGDAGRVIAFEPSSVTFERLKYHVNINQLTNIELERLAAYCVHNTTINLNIYPDGYSAWNTIGHPSMRSRDDPQKDVQPIGNEKVPTVTVDMYCEVHNIEQINYLKVDVEVAEVDVLVGCSELLKRKAIQYLQFEVSQKMINGLERRNEEIFAFLVERGYMSHPISINGKLLPPVQTSTVPFANFIALPT